MDERKNKADEIKRNDYISNYKNNTRYLKFINNDKYDAYQRNGEDTCEKFPFPLSDVLIKLT